MIEPDHILISVEWRHAVSMLKGDKIVELRRRPVRIVSGTRVWIYSKVPRGSVEALAIVDDVVEASPRRIWEVFGHRSGICRNEFEAYFYGANLGCAILFKEVRRLKPVLSLDAIRQRLSGFQPPQFFKRLAAGSPELLFFRSILTFQI